MCDLSGSIPDGMPKEKARLKHPTSLGGVEVSENISLISTLLTPPSTGRHPCLGMRFAKLEIKCIIAYFLLQFDYDLVDARNRAVTKIPEVDRNHL